MTIKTVVTGALLGVLCAGSAFADRCHPNRRWNNNWNRQVRWNNNNCNNNWNRQARWNNNNNWRNNNYYVSNRGNCAPRRVVVVQRPVYGNNWGNGWNGRCR